MQPLKLGWGHHPAVEESGLVLPILRHLTSICDMKDCINFKHRIEMLDDHGELLEHLPASMISRLRRQLGRRQYSAGPRP
jgi:hypothetical protein